jgi:hypothetical protein
LQVLPIHRVQCEHQFAANIMDHVPVVNILPFGTCTALLGPCVPATLTPWTPGAVNVLLDNQPALDNVSICMCSVGGVVSVLYPGQSTTVIP